MKKDAFTIAPVQQKFYTITTKTDRYGIIIPSGQVKVRAGSHKQFVMQAVRGAEIVNATVDGIPITLDHNRYTFINVTADHTLCLNTRALQRVVANLTTNQTSGPAPLTIKFTDTSSGSPTRWLWKFGDGKMSTLQNPEHTYTRQGRYSVRLVALNAYSTDSITKNNFIRVTAVRMTDTPGNESVISGGIPPESSGSNPLTGRSILPAIQTIPVSPRQEVNPAERELA